MGGGGCTVPMVPDDLLHRFGRYSTTFIIFASQIRDVIVAAKPQHRHSQDGGCGFQLLGCGRRECGMSSGSWREHEARRLPPFSPRGASE